MKIRMMVQMSGTRNGEPWPNRGEVAELPTVEAAQLVASGIAGQVPEPAENTTAPLAETSSVPEPEAPAVPEPETRRGRPRKPRAVEGDTTKE